MATEAASEKPHRGRRPVFSDDELRQAAQFAYARRVRTRRGAQDLVYRKFAVAALELFRESHPEEGAPLAWLLQPMPRYSLLSELGRIAEPHSGQKGSLEWRALNVRRLIEVAHEVVRVKPTTKAGVAMIREHRRRFREETAA